MPLTAKGTEILSAMQKEYGEKEGERVFYASRNAGVVSGVDSEYELEGKSVFNVDSMAEQISSLGSEAKRLAERMDSKDKYKKETEQVVYSKDIYEVVKVLWGAWNTVRYYLRSKQTGNSVYIPGGLDSAKREIDVFLKRQNK